MDIKSLWTKFDQISEATDHSSKESCNECGSMLGECEHGMLEEGTGYAPGDKVLANGKPAKIVRQIPTPAGSAKYYAIQFDGKNYPGDTYDQIHANRIESAGVSEGEMSSRTGDRGETIRVHRAKAGGYGRKIDKDDESGDKFHSSDIDDTDDAPAPAVKRGRGRPVKNANSDTGEAPKFDSKVAQALQSYVVGNLPKKMDKVGKTSHINRLKEHMQQIETKILIEGMMSELDIIRQDIESGDLDVYDIIVDKFVPHGKAEEFAVKMIKDAFEEMTRFTGDDGGPDAMDKIQANIEAVLSGRGSLEEVAIGGTGAQTAQQQPQAGQAAAGSTQAEVQPAKVMAGGKVVGTAPTPQVATQATPLMTDIANKEKQLAKLGVSQVQESRESLADTMNKFSSALDTKRTKRTLTESALTKVELVMEGTLEEILQVYPHEHKMCQEGWGMDEAMFEALCDHYHREGKIPRAVWHGSMDELRKHVEECYMQDTQQLMGEDTSADLGLEPGSFDQMDKKTQTDILTMPSPITVADEGAVGSAVGTAAGKALGAGAGPIGSAVGGMVGGAIGDKVGNMFDESDDLMKELDEELERVLTKDNAMYESKKPSAGMTTKEKSAVAKKAQKGGDIGKPGKGFAAVAKKAGGGEKGKKIAAAAMWKNAAHQQHESIDEATHPKGFQSSGHFADKKRTAQGLPKPYPKLKDTTTGKTRPHPADPKPNELEEATDAEQIAHDLGAHKRKLAREKNRAEITGMMSAEHPTKRSGEREQAKIKQTNRQLQKPEVVDEGLGKKIAHGVGKVVKAVAPKWVDSHVKADDEKRSAAKKSAMDKFQSIAQKSEKKVNEGKFGQMDADLADLSPKEFKEEYGMTKAEARAKHGGTKPAEKSDTKKLDEMDNPDWHADIGKKEVMVKPITAKKMKKDAGKALDKAFKKETPKKVKESYDFSQWDQQLAQLIEGKKPAQPQQIDESARSITKRAQLNEAGLADLIAMIKNAGMSAPAPAPGTMEIEIDDEMTSDPEQNTAAYRDGGVYDGTGSPALMTQSTETDPHTKFNDADDVPVMAMPRGMGMSQNTEGGVESHVVEPVMSDEVIDHLQSGESDDAGDNTLAFIKKTMNHGETPIDVVQTSKAAGSGDYEVEVAEDNYGDTQSAGASATGSSPSPMANKAAPSMNVHEEEDEEVEEGNAFSGAVAKAKADGIQKGEKITVGGKEYPVKEQAAPVDPAGKGEINPNNGDLAADEAGEAAQDNAAASFDQAQAASQPMQESDDEKDTQGSISNILKKLEKLGQMMSDHKKKPVKEGDDMNMVANRHSELEVNEGAEKCKDCGGKMGKDHDCEEQLNEWANSPSGQSEGESFDTDIDFMTRGISGGLNNQKQDQTLVGSGPNRVVTQTEREDVNQSMGALLKKLSGIN